MKRFGTSLVAAIFVTSLAGPMLAQEAQQKQVQRHNDDSTGVTAGPVVGPVGDLGLRAAKYLFKNSYNAVRDADIPWVELGIFAGVSQVAPSPFLGFPAGVAAVGAYKLVGPDRLENGAKDVGQFIADHPELVANLSILAAISPVYGAAGFGLAGIPGAIVGLAVPLGLYGLTEGLKNVPWGNVWDFVNSHPVGNFLLDHPWVAAAALAPINPVAGAIAFGLTQVPWNSVVDFVAGHPFEAAAGALAPLNPIAAAGAFGLTQVPWDQAGDVAGDVIGGISSGFGLWGGGDKSKKNEHQQDLGQKGVTQAMDQLGGALDNK